MQYGSSGVQQAPCINAKALSFSLTGHRVQMTKRQALESIFAIATTAVLASGCGSNSNDGNGNVISLGDELGLNASNVTLDPFGTAPLSARLEFKTPLPGKVRVTVAGKPLENDDTTCTAEDGISISHQFAATASDFELPLLGLYADYTNTVYVDFEAADGRTTRDTLQITTGPVAWPIKLEIASNSLPAGDSGVYLFSQQKSAFDQCGEVRWLYRGEGWQFFEQLPNGNWLGTINTDQISYHFRGYSEFTMLGETVREYLVPDYLHHEVQKLPWGNYLVAGNSSQITLADDGVPEEDTLVEIDAVDGAVVKVWDFNTILDPTRPPIPSNNRADDWLHLNSAVYDASDDSILITAQRQSLMAKIDYATGELKWILGSHAGWSEAHQDKLLTPVDADGNPVDVNTVYFWPYGPHAALSFGGGAVALFDNGAWRGWYGDRAPQAELGQQDFSRGIEYYVDEANMTVRIVWEFDWNQAIFTSITGDIDYLANEHYVLGFVGTSPGPDNPRVMEVDRSGNVLFNAVSNRGELEYRVEKIDLYASGL